MEETISSKISSKKKPDDIKTNSYIEPEEIKTNPQIKNALDKLNTAQIALLKSIKRPINEYNKDIIWLKRLDLVGDVEKQEEANKLFRIVIKKNNLFSKDKPLVKIISSVDNVWENKDLEKKGWYEFREN